MKARDLINLQNGGHLGTIVKLGANRYSFNHEVLSFRGLCTVLEEMGVRVCYL